MVSHFTVPKRVGDRVRASVPIGKARYRTGRLLASLERFHALLGEAEACLRQGGKPADCAAVFGQRLREQFLVYRVDAALLTAYYTPRIEVSTRRSERFRYPIYRTPDTTRERRLSRDDIDFGRQLDGKGYELYYAADRGRRPRPGTRRRAEIYTLPALPRG